MCRNLERVMEMYSKELQELDRNTVQYMIDEMQETINRKNAQLNQKDSMIENQSEQLAQLKQLLEEQNQQIQALQSQINSDKV